MRSRLFALPCLLVVLLARPGSAQTLTWLVNNTTNIGGLTATNNGAPTVISTPYGNAVLFNGVNDGLTLGTNPIASTTNFTVEMIFRPDPITHADAWQPRIFHIQSPSPPDHRLTLEARVTNNTWFADVFLRTSVSSNLTLIDSNKIHSLGEWHHLAATYDGTTFRSYVDGVLELSGALAASAMTNGLSSIGMRANKINFFEGAVLALRFSRRVLVTNEFMCIPVTHLNPPALTNGQAGMDFELVSGLPLGFTLQETATPAGGWSNSVGAVLTTNAPGTSYRYTVPAPGEERFYRLRWP